MREDTSVLAKDQPVRLDERSHNLVRATSSAVNGLTPSSRSSRATGPELWGGHECTLNRVGERFIDQTLLSGHEFRPDDIDLFAGLGLKRLRYPALWERTEIASGVLDFGWLDERLPRIRQAGMEPIVGLLHHGSGPLWTSLIDPRFPEAFAEYALAVARRYPWVDAYTPINEPLTTARFSGLYGHWHPHRRDERSMWLAVLNQIDGTRLAMRAIRSVNPGARLVQTEDLGRCQSTRRLAYQAAFENDRRWLTWDLLLGRVTQDHAIHGHIAALGFGERLARIADDPCGPDIVGVNHYPTSERFLDHRIDLHAPELAGGNGRDRYVDVEAVRVSQTGISGFEPLLAEAWDRYGLPVAVTECHIGCTREEQLRWLAEAWDGASRLRRQGCDIVAVTAWSLLGAYGWDSLLTRGDGRYESGVFDLSGPRPRPTALADTARRLSQGQPPAAIAAAPGWWRRDARLTLGRVVRSAQDAPQRAGLHPSPGADEAPILITGATGTLGQAVAAACRVRGLAHKLTSRSEMRVEDAEAVDLMMLQLRPWAVINAAGWVRVDEAEDDEAACFVANATGPAVLARACAVAGVLFVTVSSDLVFDGRRAEAYCEGDAPAPLNAYGRSKLAAERAVSAAGGQTLTVRTAAFFQEADPHNFAVQALDQLSRGVRFEAAEDLIVSPTYVPDLVRATLDLLIDGETGVWHLANQGRVSWCEFARGLATAAGCDAGLVVARPASSFGWKAPRPAQAALDSERGRLLPPLEDAIARFIERRRMGELHQRSEMIAGVAA